MSSTKAVPKFVSQHSQQGNIVEVSGFYDVYGTMIAQRNGTTVGQSVWRTADSIELINGFDPLDSDCNFC